MENPSCASTPPETILALLWTTVAVFGIVYAILGYRCLRAIGFLSGLAAGAGCIFWLQSQEVALMGNQADSGKFIVGFKCADLRSTSFIRFNIALAIVTGLFGAVLGSTHPIAAVLVCACAGAITSGSIITFCVATLPNHLFGIREIAVAVGGGAIIFAVMTLLCVKFITIVSSSIVGSTMMMAAVDFFMHGSSTLLWVCFERSVYARNFFT